MRISGKVRTVHLVTLLPLAALLVVVLYASYASRVSLIGQDRLNNAQLVATAFSTSMTDLAGAARSTGTATLHPRTDPDVTAASLRQLAQSFPLHWAAITDVSGRVTHSSDPAMVGASIADPALGKAAGGQLAALGTARHYGGVPGFVVASPVIDETGRTRALSVQFVDGEALGRRLSQAQISGGANIVDRSGHLVVLLERPALARSLPSWLTYEPVRHALAGQVEVDRNWAFPITGERRIVAEVPIEPWGWAAGSGVDYSSAMAPFMRALTITVLLGLVVLAVSSAVVAVQARALVDSVGSLTVQAEQVGRRERSTRVVASGDEIETVSRILADTSEELSRYITGLERIGESGRLLTGALSRDEVEQAIRDAAVGIFGANAVWVFLYNPGVGLLELVLWHSTQGVEAPDADLRPGEGIAGRAFADDELAIVRDTREVGDFAWRALAEDGLMSALIDIPLEVGGTTFGVLGLSAPDIEEWEHDGREVGLVYAFAAQVAAALENTRLYENERTVADTLQQALLTIPEHVSSMDFAHTYHSASHIARVGGDFYDLFELEHGRYCVLIGDVAGKGLGAAVLTSLVKSSVHAHASEHDKSPAQVASLVNALVYRETPSDAFVTMFLAYIEADGVMTYCNAGHTSGGVIRDSTVDRLPSNSPLLGAFPDFDYTDTETTLDYGDILVLYTDGLIEARAQHDLFGEERLFVLLDTLRGARPETTVDAMLAAVTEFTGGVLSDDLAILTLTRCPPDA